MNCVIPHLVRTIFLTPKDLNEKFYFPKGNIDKPFIKQSSGVEVLDTLAVRAVLDSVPYRLYRMKGFVL